MDGVPARHIRDVVERDGCYPLIWQHAIAFSSCVTALYRIVSRMFRKPVFIVFQRRLL